MRGKITVAVVLLMLALVGCQKPPPEYESHYTPPPSPGVAPAEIQVGVIGDSYTSGTPVGGLGDKGWPALAQKQLRSQGLDVDLSVGAEGGSGYVDPGGKGHVFGDQILRAVKPDDQLVVLYGSSNDATDTVPLDKLATTIGGVMSQVKTRAPKAKLLVIGPNFTHPDPPPGILAVRDVVEKQAQEAGATWVDPIAEGWFLDRQDLIAPDAHPTDDGHKYLAQKIAPLIAAQLTVP